MPKQTTRVKKIKKIHCFHVPECRYLENIEDKYFLYLSSDENKKLILDTNKCIKKYSSDTIGVLITIKDIPKKSLANLFSIDLSYNMFHIIYLPKK